MSGRLSDPGSILGFREGAFLRLGILALAVACTFEDEERPDWFGAAAYVGLLAWLFFECVQRPDGQTLLTVAWALQGAVTFAVATSRRFRPLQHAGLATLVLVGGKLLLYDLEQADPLVRVVLFLGFGGTLIGLAYLANRPRKAAAP